MNKKTSLLLFSFVLLMHFMFISSAKPPFQQTPLDMGLILETAYSDAHQQNTDLYVHAHIYNSSDGLILPTNQVSCYSHAYSHNLGGRHILSNITLTSYGVGHNATIPSFYFADTGQYSILIWCNTSSVGGFFQYTIDVTPNGELPDTGTAVFYIGLLAVLLFFLSVTIVSFMQFDNLLSRVGMIELSYILLIAITFISWNMASDFLTSSPFLISMLRTLFFVLIIGFFPLVLGGFAWYFLMLWKIKEIQRLINKGMPEWEAKRRSGLG